MQIRNERIYPRRTYMKKFLVRLVCLLMTTVLIMTYLVGCNDLDKGKSNGEKGPHCLCTNDINEFIELWYKVQSGQIQDVEGEPQTDEEYENRNWVRHLLPFKSLVYPLLKNDEYILLEAGTFDDPKIMCYHYLNKELGHSSDMLLVYIFSEELFPYYMYDNGAEGCVLTDEGRKGYDKEYNRWDIDLGDCYMYIQFPSDVDASSPDIIYEYFDFNQINIVEYESQMK